MKRVKTSINTQKPLVFKIKNKYKRARQSLMTLPHGPVNLPIFMPVGTKGNRLIETNIIGTLKGLTSKEIEDLDCWLMLGNTYHLNNSPGAEFLFKLGNKETLYDINNYEYWIKINSIRGITYFYELETKFIDRFRRIPNGLVIKIL